MKIHHPIAALLALAALTLPAQERSLPLASTAGLTLHNTQASAVSFKGKSALKVTSGPAAAPAGANVPAKEVPGRKAGGGEAVELGDESRELQIAFGDEQLGDEPVGGRVEDRQLMLLHELATERREEQRLAAPGQTEAQQVVATAHKLAGQQRW